MQISTETASSAGQNSGHSDLAKQPDAGASIGLEVWRKVQETDPEVTKAFSKGGFLGTAIAPMYQFQRATEIFGPYGIGWGVEVLSESYIDGIPLMVNNAQVGKEVIHKVYVELWYFYKGHRGSVKQFGATTYISRDHFGVISSDEDHAKKSQTDATSKCLSMLGFSADVFMGKYDDNKYVEGLRAKFDLQRSSTTQSTESTEASQASNAGPSQSVSGPTRYEQYKDRLAQKEKAGESFDVAAVRATIEQDSSLTKMEIQTLLQFPLLRIPAPESNKHQDASTTQSSVFL
ncbi:hypothetical protein [Pseudomonas abietaniphila]|uniref:Rad52/22 family double-strand break repair protein n=1 Tax=Pseudomonas abietaniphila TaxID=89065 RepID=A0A1G8QN77_9PSED|nr:hypothetical protein [Pseudomonas abietaniphila]SDJ06204.1 hypothetical protein SAMN05216605_1219 [Pseudomonas abietaniphila]